MCCQVGAGEVFLENPLILPEPVNHLGKDGLPLDYVF